MGAAAGFVSQAACESHVGLFPTLLRATRRPAPSGPCAGPPRARGCWRPTGCVAAVPPFPGYLQPASGPASVSQQAIAPPANRLDHPLPRDVCHSEPQRRISPSQNGNPAGDHLERCTPPTRAPPRVILSRSEESSPLERQPESATTSNECQPLKAVIH